MKYFTALILAAVLCILIACVPAARVTSTANNTVNADGASLTLERKTASVEVTFSSGNTPAESVALFVQGENISTDDPACSTNTQTMTCTFEIVPKTRVVKLQGSKLSANATFYRKDSIRPYFVLGVVP